MNPCFMASVDQMKLDRISSGVRSTTCPQPCRFDARRRDAHHKREGKGLLFKISTTHHGESLEVDEDVCQDLRLDVREV